MAVSTLTLGTAHQGRLGPESGRGVMAQPPAGSDHFPKFPSLGNFIFRRLEVHLGSGSSLTVYRLRLEGREELVLGCVYAHAKV